MPGKTVSIVQGTLHPLVSALDNHPLRAQYSHTQGVGVRATTAHAAEHVPSAPLQAMMAGGARGAAKVPKVKPAAA